MENLFPLRLTSAMQNKDLFLDEYEYEESNRVGCDATFSERPRRFEYAYRFHLQCQSVSLARKQKQATS